MISYDKTAGYYVQQEEVGWDGMKNWVVREKNK